METPSRENINLNLHSEESEKINEKAQQALIRIKKKFYGRDFDNEKVLSVNDQIDRLIREAISYENLCQSWPGWCPYW